MGSFNDFLGNKEIEHHEKYQTIINALGYEEVKKCVPFSLDKIEKSMKEDIYLNNLPLSIWDAAAIHGSYLTNLYKKIGVNCYSLSDGVSILKECARIMVNKNIQKGATNV